uniref:NADH dehydrogenase subunit 6 n=1 Tax=Ditylenchus dipsaci TaxID=166011 RepID=A0A915ECJ3_9BILA
MSPTSKAHVLAGLKKDVVNAQPIGLLLSKLGLSALVGFYSTGLSSTSSSKTCAFSFFVFYKPRIMLTYLWRQILELDVNNFNSTVYNKPTAFLVEFYSSCVAIVLIMLHILSVSPHWSKTGKV